MNRVPRQTQVRSNLSAARSQTSRLPRQGPTIASDTAHCRNIVWVVNGSSPD